MRKCVTHAFDPVYDKHSKVLILGTMPSVKSREVGFYYGHPKNRFWWALEQVFDEKIEDKVAFLKKHSLALWDVLKTCEIVGSSDASIKNGIPNDLESVIKNSDIKVIFTTGKTAYRYYMKFFKEKMVLPVHCLPSPSPANCRVKNDELVKAYQILKKYL